MKATELIQLFEYGKAFGRAKEPKRRKKEKMKITFKEYLEFQDEIERFQKLMKEKADEEKKLAKMKEQKKEGISPIHLAMVLIGSFPITAPLYVWWMKYMLVDMWK